MRLLQKLKECTLNIFYYQVICLESMASPQDNCRSQFIVGTLTNKAKLYALNIGWLLNRV